MKITVMIQPTAKPCRHEAAMIAIDTNLIVYAHRAACPERITAQQALTRVAANPSRLLSAAPVVAKF